MITYLLVLLEEDQPVAWIGPETIAELAGGTTRRCGPGGADASRGHVSPQASRTRGFVDFNHIHRLALILPKFFSLTLLLMSSLPGHLEARLTNAFVFAVVLTVSTTAK